MRHLCRVSILLLILAVLAGCGRSGKVRMPVVGDSATYTLSGSVIAPNGRSVPISGSSTYSVAASRRRAVTGKFTRTFESTTRDTLEGVSGKRGTITLVSWYGVDASNALHLLGRSLNGGPWEIVTGQDASIVMPAVLNKSSEWSNTLRMSNGFTEKWSNKVVLTEKVSTPAGMFDTYKLQHTVTASNGVTTTGSEWVAVETGIPVKDESEIPLKLGSVTLTMRLTYVLQKLHLKK